MMRIKLWKMKKVKGYYAACSRDFLALNKIHIIVNCGYELKNQFPATIIYKNIPLDDVDDAPLLEYIDSAVDFIDKYISGGENVLVHCQMGRSKTFQKSIQNLARNELRSNPYGRGQRICIDSNWIFDETLQINTSRSI